MLNSKIFIALIVCLVWQANNSCFAYYWGYGSGWGYYGLGSSLLWPLNSIFYSGYSAPSSLTWPLYSLMHMGNRAANNTAVNSYQNIPYNNSYSGMGSYGAAPGLNYPFNYNGNYPNNNQAPVPVWNQSPAQQSTSSNSVFNDPNDIFNYRYPATGSTQAMATSSSANDVTLPPLAPNRNNTITKDSSNVATRNAEVVRGFFETVIKYYKGDLIKALNETNMRAWAESIGLIKSDSKEYTKISRVRKDEINNIVKDFSLDAEKKLDIINLLLQN